MKRLLGAIAVGLCGSACLFGPSREGAIERAISEVKETMRVAAPDLPHPEPYKYQDAGDCAWVPEMPSSKETLRYQAEITLPTGDDGLERQAKVIKYWTDKGATIRELPYRTGPASEVEYKGSRILAFPLPSARRGGPPGTVTFAIAVTTPCIPKSE